MQSSTYNLDEIIKFMEISKGIYDLVRLVDPEETMELHINREKDSIEYACSCHHVWECSHRCSNCSSLKAHESGSRIEKTELFKDNVYHVQSNPVTIMLPDGNSKSVVLELITNRQATNEDKQTLVEKDEYDTLSNVYYHNPLTGFYNTEGFRQAAREFINSNKEAEHIITIIEIQQLRLILDLFGKERGNEITLGAAQCLKEFESKECIIAFFGDGRFGICTSKEIFDQIQIDSIGEKIRDILGSSNFRVEVKSGIYACTDSSLSIDEMCYRAQMALDVISGRGHEKSLNFDSSMLEDLLYRQKVIGIFDQALFNEEFKIFLQPQVDKDGKLLGAEALARWIRPDGSIIPPFKFIEILEESGLIGQMDLSIWDQAARKLKEWENTEHKDLYISINISPLDFYFVDVYAAITGLIDKYQIDKRKLRLEITETALMVNEEKDLPVVNALRKQGFLIEIDDFGKGYSSLNMLKNIEADVLKIDMRFLEATNNDDRGQAIIRMVIELAARLDMEVISEGVETSEQVDMLFNLGCTHFQGYYFAKPMSIEDFEKKY